MSVSGRAPAPARCLSEISEEESTVRLSIDLVAAARRNIGFLRLVAESYWLHQKPTIIEAIRRYDVLWMPLISDLTVGITPPVVLPPLDIEWVWYCHCLNPVSYRQYCESKFSKLIGKPAIFNEENEDYAYNRCREIWIHKYPSEPFEKETDLNSKDPTVVNVLNENLLGLVSKYGSLYSTFSEPYMSEIVYLIAAKQRYKGFLYMMQRFGDTCSVLIPTKDILLLWLTHQSYPTVYNADFKEMEGKIEKVVGAGEFVKEEDVEETKKLWERTFGQPYEKAGCPAIGQVVKVRPQVYWDVVDNDVNTKYKSVMPRFLLEVCVMANLNLKSSTSNKNIKNEFLRLRFSRCHKALKLNKPISVFASDTWQKAWHLYCEFGTKGVILELRALGSFCFKGSGTGSSLKDTITFSWNDLSRAPSLTIGKEVDPKVSLVVSITPPVQGPYLLKCVPDRVTDDSGAMISDVVLRMNQYRPQEGRWLSRTVLDHAGRECFIVRMRVCGGFWRRGGETPSVVKWEDRIIEIREGSWSYIAGSIGRAPEKVVGTAKPKVPSEGWQSSWSFSTGDELSIRWGSSTSASASASASSLCIDLKNQASTDSSVRVLLGRQMQYHVKNSNNPKEAKENTTQLQENEVDNDGQEDGFITLVRSSDENPIGKATALLNWKLLAAEISPEEDAVLVLLLCVSILKSMCEMRKEDIGNLLVRRRLKEAKLGDRDWGSVVLSSSSSSSSSSGSSPFVQPWYWNAKAVLGSNGVDQPPLNYLPEEGGDKLYKRGVIG